jgi:CHAT domain-containing protein/tetratricopeptide (TPR) repeat protein
MTSGAAQIAAKLGLARFAAAALSIAIGGHALAGDRPLAAGTSHDESAKAGETRSYRIALGAGQAAEVSLRQRDATALELRWSAADAPPLVLRTEAGRDSLLRATLAADKATLWTVSVAPARNDVAFRYSIALTPAHAIAEADRARVAGTSSLAEAEALRGKGDKAAADDARKRYRDAIESSRRANDGCAVRHAYVAWSGFEHEIVDAAAQKTTAQAAVDATCDDGAADEALALRLLGSAYINQGDFASGTRETERAVAAFKETGDAYQQGVALRNLGLAYAESGEIEKALATTQSALRAAEQTGDGKLLALVRNDLAFMHNVRGEFALAIDAYRQTLDTLAANPYPMAEAVAWINLGIAYGQLGDGEQAMDAYAKGEKTATAIDCWSCLAEIAVDRGDDLLDDGKAAAAEASYKRALEIADAHALVRQRAEALRGLGRSAMTAQDWDRARMLFEQARDELHRTHGVVNESVVYSMLGDLDNRLNRHAQARANYDHALELAKQADNQAWQAVAYASRARVAEQTGDLAGARRDIEEAIALIESERTRISAPDLRTSYFGTKRSYYALYIDILMRLDDAAGALVVAERARARELQDQLAERAIDVDKDVDPNLIAGEHEAEDALHALAYQLSQVQDSDTNGRMTLGARIDEASRALDAARGRIHAANPRYAELKHPAALSVAEIQRDLVDANVSVLEYWLGDEKSYLWVVSHDALRAFVLPPRATIERDVDTMRAKLLAPAAAAATSIAIEQRAAADTAGVEATRAAAASLAAEILPPGARALMRHDFAIVADGELQSLPFAVLGTDAAHVYLPSIGALRGLRAVERPAVASNRVAILADPVFRADDERLGGRAAKTPATDNTLLLRAATEAGIANLPRLPHTRDEAQAIAALADRNASWLALDFAANRDAAVGARWNDYGIAHFATHALLNARHPELSGIVLSLYGKDGRAEDGFLRVNDIYNLHMPADLVVLSVCESAVGKSIGGEGAATLARAFFYAGARRVVASLWPVDDRASVAFMRAFYGAMLGKHLRPQQALIEAQREMRANPRWLAPYYWSGYIVEGDWR